MSETNTHLNNFCLQKIIGFIYNENRHLSYLDKKELHLSNKGKAIFAKNLIGYMNRVGWDFLLYDSNVDENECLSNTLGDTNSSIKSV